MPTINGETGSYKGEDGYTTHVLYSKVLLPKVIYAAPGLEVNIYFDNVVCQAAPGQYLFDVTCAKGMQQTDRWTWTPNAEDAGDYPLQIEMRDFDDKILAVSGTVIHVSGANAGAGKSVKVLCIGDSLTAASVYTGELQKFCSDENNPQMRLLGTAGPGDDAGNRHEGYGGWQYATFLTKWVDKPPPDAAAKLKSSPFLFLENGKPTFDFSRYLQEKLNGQIPDLITIMLGTNDVFNATDQTRWKSVEAMIANARKLAGAIRAGAPNTKIAVLPPVPPSQSQDAFGANEGCGQTRWGYRKNQFLAGLRLMQDFGNRESENLCIVPAYTNLDCKHNYPDEQMPVNARNTTKVQRATNAVHPAAAGYLQIADSIYSWIKSQL